MSLLEGEALFARIQEDLNDLAPRLIYSDWLEENERSTESLLWRGARVSTLQLFDLYGSGYGDGYNITYANSDSHGSGAGYGGGSGEGYGRGDSHGYGRGDDQTQEQNKFCIENQKIIGRKPMIGKNMLLWCGRGFAWIGKVEEMYVPGAYRLSCAGMLCRTGGDSWMHVANGTARQRYIYRHAPDGVVYTGSDIHGAVEWKGDLPGEDKN